MMPGKQERRVLEIDRHLSQYIKVEWPAPANIKAYSTTRIGGSSLPPYDQFNLAFHVNDDMDLVCKNRKRLINDLKLKVSPLWLSQVHGTRIVDADRVIERSNHESIEADGSFCRSANQACIVMTADCLPILLSNKMGSWVAAVHAGWRGLADGVVKKAIESYSGCSSELIAWMGPAIGPKYFEVGVEVKKLFESKLNLKSHRSAVTDCFVRLANGKFLCDLYSITRFFLTEQKVSVYGGDRCTYSEDAYFFSYRRDGPTGRMASLIWIDSP